MYVNFVLKGELASKLARASIETGVSRVAVIKIALSQYLEKVQPELVVVQTQLEKT